MFSLTDVLDILEVFQDHLQVRPLARSSPPLSDSRLATTWRIATKERPLAIFNAGTPAFAQPTFLGSQQIDYCPYNNVLFKRTTLC